jgi:hypothetical protein
LCLWLVSLLWYFGSRNIHNVDFMSLNFLLFLLLAILFGLRQSGS